MGERPHVLVVISYYADRPVGPLVALLDSIATFPAGAPIEVRVVVNRNLDHSVSLPQRHESIEIILRPNVGYNIGAWEAGWRQDPTYDGYLFLQDECRIVQSDWVGAFARTAAKADVGLVGESFNPDWNASWAELAAKYRGQRLPEHEVDGRPAERVEYYLDFFRQHNIPAGVAGDHLQSLVFYMTRSMLERIGGFPVGSSYGEAIAAEIGISKHVQAAGCTLVQVGPEPFFYIEHPQWLHRRRDFARSGSRPSE